MDVLAKLKLVEAHFAKELHRHAVDIPKTAIVLGSGLGDVAEAVEDAVVIAYEEIEGFPVSTAPGHKGRFIIGKLGDVSVVIMQGRIHYYEGYDMTDVVLPVRVLALLGVENFILTNAAGGMQDGMKIGDFMMITDHISSFVPSPLIGQNFDELGLRFFDMTQAYDLELSKAIRDSAKKLKIDLREGIYAQLTGPQFETPIEITMMKQLGADVVGMSTVVETIALRHMNKRVAGISCVTNLAAGISDVHLCGNDVVEVGIEVGPHMTALLKDAVKKM